MEGADFFALIGICHDIFPLMRRRGREAFELIGLGERSGLDPVFQREVAVDKSMFMEKRLHNLERFHQIRVEPGQKLIAVIRLQVCFDFVGVDAALPARSNRAPRLGWLAPNSPRE